jgi:hypothetical protein
MSRCSFFCFKEISALVCLALWLGYTSLPRDFRSLRVRGTHDFVTYAKAAPSTVNALGSIESGIVIPSDEFMVKKSGQLATRLESDKGPQIAWLMSFPNSGTTYTIEVIRKSSLTTTGTNYGYEVPELNPVPIFPDQPTGPFWYEPLPVVTDNDADTLSQPRNYTRLASKNYVMVKTHCGMRCEQCSPHEYVETMFSFRRNCYSGGYMHDGRMVLTSYYNNPSSKSSISQPQQNHDVAKAIHLIRNPFDNVVSRFHLEQRKAEATGRLRYPKNRDGFRAFCQEMNDEYVSNERGALFLDNDLLDVMAHVPCRADFIRYTEWHNLAFATTSDMNLASFILHYDQYETRFEETIRELQDFLDLKDLAEPEPFVAGKVYGDYFTDEEKRAVAKGVKTMATRETWTHISYYFDQ